MNGFVKLIVAAFFSLYVSDTYTQVLDNGSVMAFELNDGTPLSIAKKVSGFDQSEEVYYYLPAHLTFSKTKNNDPEFSFLAYKEGDEITGGILHFLIKWGLDRNQLQQADSILKSEKGPEAVLMGAVMPEASLSEQSIRIEGSSKVAHILNNSKSTLGKTAILPNTKMAASFHLNKNDAITFQEILNNNSRELEDVFLTLNFEIKFREPGKPGIVLTPYIIRENLKNLLNQ